MQYIVLIRTFVFKLLMFLFPGGPLMPRDILVPVQSDYSNCSNNKCTSVCYYARREKEYIYRKPGSYMNNIIFCVVVWRPTNSRPSHPRGVCADRIDHGR